MALDNLKKKLEAKRQELEKEFDDRLQAREEEAAKQRLIDRPDGTGSDQGSLRGPAQARSTCRMTGGKRWERTSMEIDDRKFQLQVDQDDYERLYRRIKLLELEQDRPARVTPFSPADVIETNDRRPKLAIAAVFGALACGFGLAFLRDRMDKTLQTPEDVTRQLDLPVLGTTTSSRAIKPALLAEQIAGDYQTIRTNLGLAYEGGLPRRLVVSSAGTREGKTTFAVNLATSLAKSGKKVLLIDGDLRKPDVGQMLNVPPETCYLQDVLLGGDASHLVYVSPTSGLHVLAANPRHLADPYELLTSSHGGRADRAAGAGVRSRRSSTARRRWRFRMPWSGPSWRMPSSWSALPATRRPPSSRKPRNGSPAGGRACWGPFSATSPWTRACTATPTRIGRGAARPGRKARKLLLATRPRNRGTMAAARRKQPSRRGAGREFLVAL